MISFIIRKRILFGNTLTFFGETHKYVENLNVPYRAFVHHRFNCVDNYGIAQQLQYQMSGVRKLGLL